MKITNIRKIRLPLVVAILMPVLLYAEAAGEAQGGLWKISKPEEILDLHAQGVDLASLTNTQFLVAMSYPLRSGKAGFYFNGKYRAEMDLPERVSRILIETTAMGIDVNVKDENGRTLLLNSLSANYKELADILIVKGADIYAVDKDKRTALMQAAEQKNIKVALFLLQKGLNAKAEDKEGRSVLLYALKGGSDRVVEAVLESGADVNHKDNHGITPLMSVSHFREPDDRDHSKIAERLIKLGAHVNDQDEQGWTPLIHATYYGETEIAISLIEAGADVNHKDKHGRDAMEFARANKRERVISAIKSVVGKKTENSNNQPITK